MKPEEAFVPGTALNHIEKGLAAHAALRHPKDLKGRSPAEYAAAGRRDILSADRAIAVRQGRGEHALFVNSKTGMSGWINTTNPSRSTYFRPSGTGGAPGYLARREKRLAQKGQQPRRLDLPAIRAQAKQLAKPQVGVPAVKRQPLRPRPIPVATKTPDKGPVVGTKSPDKGPVKATPPRPQPLPVRTARPPTPRPNPPAPRGPRAPRR